MNNRNVIETLMGGTVLLVAFSFLFFAYEKSTMKHVEGYDIKAVFDDISGIATGSEVRVGGIKVGVVKLLDLDPKTYRATAHLSIEDGVELPVDTSASVSSSGLLGDKFIKLDPGGQEEMLKEEGVIKFTQSSVNLEELLGKFVFSAGGVESGADEEAAAEKEASEAPKEEKDNPFSLGF